MLHLNFGGGDIRYVGLTPRKPAADENHAFIKCETCTLQVPRLATPLAECSRPAMKRKRRKRAQFQSIGNARVMRLFPQKP